MSSWYIAWMFALLSDMGVAEQLFGGHDAGYERVDVGLVVVHVEGRARGGWHVEPPHQRLRAVVAGADADAGAVENCREIVRMHVAEREADHAAALLSCGAVDVQPLDIRQPHHGAADQLPFVPAHFVHS